MVLVELPAQNRDVDMLQVQRATAAGGAFILEKNIVFDDQRGGFGVDGPAQRIRHIAGELGIDKGGPGRIEIRTPTCKQGFVFRE